MNSIIIYWGGGNVTRNRDSRIGVILDKISQSLTLGALRVEQYTDGKIVAVHVNN